MKDSTTHLNKLRAAKAAGKWHDRTTGFDRLALDNVLAALRTKYLEANTDEAATRLGLLLRNLGHAYEPFKLAEYTTALEFRKGEWYRWQLVDGEPFEFRRLNPQPPPPAH